jgi:hypothetical protein
MSADVYGSWERRTKIEVRKLCPKGLDCRLARIALTAIGEPSTSTDEDSLIGWVCSEQCELNEALFRSAVEAAGRQMVVDGILKEFKLE